MSRYTTYPLLIGRYAKATDFGGSTDGENHFIVGAEDELDGYCGERYSVPFSPVPGFIVDLATDLAWLKMTRAQKGSEPLAKDVERRIKLLMDGKITLTVSGTQLANGNESWSENDYRSAFGRDDETNWSVDADAITDAEGERE